MRRSFKQVFQGLFAAAAVASILISPALAAEKKDFKVAWSIYVGWMPWGYATEFRHREKMGRQIRHQYRGQAVQRLRRVDQSIYRRRFRRRDHHQHGRAVDSRRRWRRHHGHHRRRLLQRQRRGDPEGQERAQRYPRPKGQSRRVLRVALSAGARAREHQGTRKGPQGRQHVRRRHGRRLQDA